jgi:hypothetical protein
MVDRGSNIDRAVAVLRLQRTDYSIGDDGDNENIDSEIAR